MSNDSPRSRTDIREIASELWYGFLEDIREDKRQEEDRLYNEGYFFAFGQGLENASAAMLDAGLEPNTILSMLQKYWKINRDEAIELAWVFGPSRRLEAYLIDQNYGQKEAQELYASLKRLLLSDRSLAKKPRETQRKAAEEEANNFMRS